MLFRSPVRTAGGEFPQAAPDSKPSDSPGLEVAEPGILRQLHLTNEDDVEPNSATVRHVRLRRGPAGSTARVLEVLCPGVGSGGSEVQPYLVYQDQGPWDLATRLAAWLDVESLDVAPGDDLGDGLSAYERGLGMALIRLRPAGRVDKAGLSQAASLLDRARGDVGLGSERQWISAVLAGYIRLTLLFEFESAAGDFAVAEGLSRQGTFERMVPMHYRASALRAMGRGREATTVLEAIVRGYAPHGHSRLYQRCVERRREGD